MVQTLLWQLSTYTIVGKSRTTGSHYLTGVSSTIAKNGGRPDQGACAEEEDIRAVEEGTLSPQLRPKVQDIWSCPAAPAWKPPLRPTVPL